MIRDTWRQLVLVAAIGFATGVSAQDDDQPDPPSQPLPTLDELLGLDETTGEDAAPERAEAELDRALETGGAIADAFEEAVRLMHDSADRLGAAGDPGAATQRVQEDILKRLEQLIEQAQQSSSQSSGSSSSSQQQSAPRDQPSQQNQQGQGKQPSSGEPESMSDGPAGQAAQPGQSTLNPAAWGALPDRLRDSLLQGSAESYSSLYRSLTEAYYRRLAEEASE